MAYKKRVQDARAMGYNVKGFQFGHHNGRHRRHTLPEGSLCDGDRNRDSYVSTLKGEEKIKAITKAFFVGKALTLGEKYDPSNIQEILRRNMRESPQRIRSLMGSTTTRRGPHGPILLPRAGSPLANAKSITFGYCRRFQYDRLLSPERKFPPARGDATGDIS